MAYVPVPKDLTKVKTKVMFNLTRRQLVCFTAGALVGVPLFLWLREPAGNSMAAMCMMLVMMPFFLLAMYEKHGQPLEVVVRNVIQTKFTRPKATLQNRKPIRCLGKAAKLRKGGISDCQKDKQKRRGKPQETGVS